jgi:phosphoenolpyruvate carboxykinase (ATP)
MAEAGAEAWLVNTGWNGEGKRLSLRDTRSIISAILNDTTGPLRTETIPVFGLAIPQSIPGVDSARLDPRSGWSSADGWQEKAESLAQLFIDNFRQYSDTEAGARLALAGPKLEPSAATAN